MTILWVAPLLVLLGGAVGVARFMGDVARCTDDLRAVIAGSAEVRAETETVRSATLGVGDAFARLGRR